MGEEAVSAEGAGLTDPTDPHIGLRGNFVATKMTQTRNKEPKMHKIHKIHVHVQRERYEDGCVCMCVCTYM
jgi:hypothetical protein